MKKAGLIFILIIVGITVWRYTSRPADEQTEPAIAGSVSPAEVASSASEPLIVEKQEPPAVEKGSGISVVVEEDPVLSAAVEIILSPESSYIVRAQQIKELRRNLSADDVSALRDFLMRPPSEFKNLSPIALNSIKNDLLEVLMDQVEMPEGLGQQIVDMYNDSSADYMWREYCLQFMAPFIEQRSESDKSNVESSTSAPSAVESSVVYEALVSALDERDQDLAGTALLGLNRLSKRNGEIKPADVITKAVEIAEDSAASARCRLTAMRVAALGGSADILPVARDLASNGSTDLLRGAAITTLGDFGDPQDRQLLEKLAATGNRQLSAAAKAALAKMEGAK